MKKIQCSVFGHNFNVSEDITAHVKEYQCKHCKKQMTTSANGNLIPLTPKYKRINSILKSVHYKKEKRKAIILDH
ncbi:hypothetical protein KO494_15035 [Lacinutrix sp. C3R15]|uniref:hypothetical protein n=1 Tax=Flavobacteriaceae TaxID=49546 RepID=UPI001C09B2EF|nr:MULTISPECIES: hypothetical protein [Flavobacteriaceae]MBU2940862.1 hypothetical protein [Lacinutrix sp. C3R15]MDO6624180.1 hypothetical protein [Oceanihabitans sp. 1_MG-2023]